MINYSIDERRYCYDLSYSEDSKIISVITNKYLYMQLYAHLEKDRRIPVYATLFDDYTELNPDKDNWGINNNFKVGCSADSIIFDTHLPVISGDVGKNDGYTRGRAILASLNILLLNLHLAGIDRGLDGPGQLLYIDPTDLSESKDYSFTCFLSSTMIRKVRELSCNNKRTIIDKIGRAMNDAHRYMSPGDKSINRCSIIIQDPKMIHFSIPEFGLVLKPIPNEKVNEGYYLYPHNVSTVLQCLTLIVGLIKLNDIARELK